MKRTFPHHFRSLSLFIFLPSTSLFPPLGGYSDGELPQSFPGEALAANNIGTFYIQITEMYFLTSQASAVRRTIFTARYYAAGIP